MVNTLLCLETENFADAGARRRLLLDALQERTQSVKIPDHLGVQFQYITFSLSIGACMTTSAIAPNILSWLAFTFLA